MKNDAEALSALIQSARGGRPRSLLCTEAEEVLNIALALLIELSVSNDRIDRLERSVAELKGQALEDFREAELDGDATQERREAADALLVRALRIMLDPRTQQTS
jgi:hypothetical protein